jgi:hypothetical protein
MEMPGGLKDWSRAQKAVGFYVAVVDGRVDFLVDSLQLAFETNNLSRAGTFLVLRGFAAGTQQETPSNSSIATLFNKEASQTTSIPKFASQGLQISIHLIILQPQRHHHLHHNYGRPLHPHHLWLRCQDTNNEPSPSRSSSP